jgi:putative ABC transport system permease protein
MSLAFAESLVFASLGGLAGLFLGGWALRALMPLFAGSLPAAIPVDIDARAALFTAAVSVILALLFGAIVTGHRPGGRLVDALKASGRTMTGSAGRARNALVVVQVALAVVLLSAAGLMMSSVIKLSHVRPGFNADHLLTFRIALSGANYTAAPSRLNFVSELLTRLKATPGVKQVALSSIIPFGGQRGANGFDIEGRPAAPGQTRIADQRHVSPEYFQTMNIPIVQGRGFRTTDDGQGEPVVIINRALANRFWPNENPIDRKVRTSAGFDSASWFRIVGVVEDVRHVSLSHDPVAEMYRPIAQTAMPIFTMVVRTDSEPASLAATARAIVQRIDPNLPIYDVRTMEDRIAASFAQTRGTMLLLLVTAALAAALSGVAIYGSIWYAVSQRIPEIGVRLALGASRGSVFGSVLRRAVTLTGIGAAIGVGASLAGSRLIAGLLFDTRATDPATLAIVVVATMGLALLAGMVPARRAMSVDPVSALRGD